MDTNTIVIAVLAIINGATAVLIVQWLKSLLKIDGGWKAYAVTLAETGIVTAGYLLFVLKTFTWPTFLIATAYAFLQASKIYDSIVKAKT
jgi:hypothetical protein